MKKLWITTIVLLLLILSSCGGELTLEDKITEVQKKTEISTKDVLALMQLDGLDYEVIEPSDVFSENWPDVTICKVGDTHYLLLSSFVMGEERTAAKNACGWWYMAPLSKSAKNAPFILNQLEQDFALENIDVVHVGDFDGKNIAAQLIPVIRHDMTSEERDTLNERHGEINAAVERIFNQYINGEMVE
jgi:hypothetical protein